MKLIATLLFLGAGFVLAVASSTTIEIGNILVSKYLLHRIIRFNHMEEYHVI